MTNNQKKILKQLLLNPIEIPSFVFSHYLCNLIKDDEKYLRIAYRLAMHKSLNLESPTTFQEKIQWLKLYDRHPEYTKMVDKYEAKKFVESKIGSQYIIPTYGVWDRAEDIDFDSLPEKFVMKCTHDSGRVIICTDKSKLDIEAARARMKKALSTNFWMRGREYPYRDVQPRVIAEKFMAPLEIDGKPIPTDLQDYKFFCFNGEPKYCQVIRDRNTKETIDFYDMNWEHQDFVGLNPVARNGLTPVARPAHLDDMIRICRELAKDQPFVRVDLYVIDDKEYFGELTFFPNSGMGVFTPDEFDKKIGDLLKLPTRTMGGGKN